MDTGLVVKQLYAQAVMLGSCKLFRGTETLGELIRLYVSPQGVEFCMEHHFPNLSTLRLFRGEHVEDYGIWIDAGEVRLDDPGRAVLIGRTLATVSCTTLSRHDLILFHGAQAMVNASGWSVVRVRAEAGCRVIKSVSGHAMIL